MIGLFGGTFDPIHNGHLRAALDILETLPINLIRFVPVGQPVHRHPPYFSASVRVQCLKLALSDQKQFILDLREIESDHPSYMVYTLESLKNEQDDTICLLLGQDAFNHLNSWYQVDRIFELCHLLIMTRPGYAVDPAIWNGLKHRWVNNIQALQKKSSGLIYMQTVTPLGISSSDIRARYLNGRSIRYLVPEKVESFLYSNQ